MSKDNKNKNNRPEQQKVLFDDHEIVGEIARDLIDKEHPHLLTARMRYICRNKAARKAGAPVAGNVYKMGGKFEYLVGSDFVMEVALEVWNNLDPCQRKALVDHLLTRCVGEAAEDGSMKWKLRPPQVQEFPEVVARNGSWNEGLRELGEELRK